MKRIKLVKVLCMAVVAVFFISGFSLADDDTTNDSWEGGQLLNGGPVITPDDVEIQGQLQIGSSAFICSVPPLNYSVFSNADFQSSITLHGSDIRFYSNGIDSMPELLISYNKIATPLDLDIGGDITSSNDLNITSDGIICIGNCD